jgi:hypothetical protein
MKRQLHTSKRNRSSKHRIDAENRFRGTDYDHMKEYELMRKSRLDQSKKMQN